MPATPAWPPSSLPRLYMDELLSEELRLVLDGPPANYLGNVLRLPSGAQVKLFDDRSGEWLARIDEVGSATCGLPRWGRGLLVIESFSWADVIAALAALLAQAQRESWPDTIEALNHELHWAFDNRRPFTG